MAILPQDKRDQTYFVIALVAVALAVVYYMYVWSPAHEQLVEDQAHVDSLVVLNQRARAELVQGKTPALRAEAARYAADLEVMRRLVPTSNEVPALLDQVSTAARRVGLDISDVQPLPVLSGDQYDAYKYRLIVRGFYHEIGTLLSNIGSLQRIIAPINLTLVPQAATDKLKGKRQPVEARFDIETYVARTVAPPPPVKAPPPPDPGKPGER